MVNTTDTSNSRFGYLNETDVLGTKETEPIKLLRFTGESLNFNADVVESAEIRADRQVADLIRTQSSVSGDINVEMSYGSFDELIAGAMFSTFNGNTSEDGDTVNVSSITAVAPFTGVLTATLGTPFAGLQEGQWFLLGGMDITANNGYKRVNIIGTAGTVITVLSEALMENDTGVVTTVTADADGSIGIGTARQSFQFEKQLDVGSNDSYDDFILNTGCVIGELEVNVATGAIMTARFGVTGLSQDHAVATAGSTTDPTDATTTDVLNSVSNIKAVLEGDSPTGTVLEIQSFSITLNNNLRPKYAIGMDSAFDIGSGQAAVTGSLTAYFTNSDMLDKFHDNTASSITFRVEDAAGNNLIFDVPNIKFSAGPVEITAIDQDVLVSMEYTAIYDGNTGDDKLGNSFFISRIDA